MSGGGVGVCEGGSDVFSDVRESSSLTDGDSKGEVVTVGKMISSASFLGEGDDEAKGMLESCMVLKRIVSCECGVEGARNSL